MMSMLQATLLVLLANLPAHELEAIHADTGRCFVTGVAPPDLRDVALRVCERARTRTSMLFGEPAAVVELRMVPGAAGEDFYVRPDAVIALIPTRRFDQWQTTAAHEIAHMLYAVRAGSHHGYGVGNGDWFMEAVAIWAEEDAQLSHRLRQAVGPHRNRIPLHHLLHMHHPSHEDAPRERGMVRTEVIVCRQCNGGPDTIVVRTVVAADGRTTVDTLPPTPENINGEQTPAIFYALSVATLAFIHDVGGPEAVRLLEQRIRSGEGGQAVLGLPGLPGTLEEFARAWNNWLDGRHVAEGRRGTAVRPSARPGRFHARRAQLGATAAGAHTGACG